MSDFYRGRWHLSHLGEEMVADIHDANISNLIGVNFGFAQFLFVKHLSGKTYVQGVLLDGEYQDKLAIIYFYLTNATVDAKLDVYSNFELVESRNCEFNIDMELIAEEEHGEVARLNIYDPESTCISHGSQVIITGQEMNKNDKMAVISKIYKFENWSTFFFGLGLYSVHQELNRVKQSYWEFQQGNQRTYASRLSIVSNILALVWMLAIGIFYISLAFIYGSFTWYFCVPMVLIALISCVYLFQIVTIQRQFLAHFSDQTVHLISTLVLLSTFLVITFFERILLSDILTTLLSGCLWFPQIVKNAQQQSKGTPRVRHALFLQLSVSWVVLYIRFNATSIFRLNPRDTFTYFYSCLQLFQIACLYLQKKWSPRLFFPTILLQLLLQAKLYAYERTTKNSAVYDDVCSICLGSLKQRVESSEEQSDASQLSSLDVDNTYYMTPCNHKFHPRCLLDWLALKLECPICRTELPPPDPTVIDTDDQDY